MKPSYRERLNSLIPGGAHTYSRGHDQFPGNAPEILVSGRGCYVTDADQRSYLDYGMGLRSVGIGYAEESIDAAAIAQIHRGNNLTRPSLIELEAAERLIALIDKAEMVKFTKNGSTAVSAAVKIARGYTGRKLIARCADHPFFSFDDWFIGSTVIKAGIPEETINHTKTFRYNDIVSLELLFEQYPNQVACVVLEPSSTCHPGPSQYQPKGNFLHDVENLCRKQGAVFILDEMITGFRWHLRGAQHYYDVTPDLSTFGKAMANGFSVAAVVGKRELMQLGSIEKPGQERLFLLSTTHGAEMCGMGALVTSLDFMEQHQVQQHYWDYGETLIGRLSALAKSHKLDNYFSIDGVPCSPWYQWFDDNGEVSPQLRTLFMQELVKQDVLMPWVALCYRHNNSTLEQTLRACDKAFAIISKALSEGIDCYLESEPVKPVFRPYN